MPDDTSPRSTAPSGQAWILTVVVIYGITASMWIFMSDQLLGYLIADPGVMVSFSQYKGWFFVFVTGMLLFRLLRHQQQEKLSALERQQQQAAKIKDLSLLSAIANASRDAIYAKDLEGRYVLFNPAGCHVVGQPQSDVIGKDDRDVFPADLATSFMQADQKAIRQRTLVTTEDTLMTPDGPRIFLTIKGPLIDKSDSVIGSFGISRDITERTETERLIQESEMRFRTLFDAMAVGISILEGDASQVVESNKMAKAQHGFVRLVMDQQQGPAQHTPFALADALDWIHKAAHSGPQHFEWKTNHKSGQAFWEDVLLHKIMLGAQERILAVTVDITTNKATEDELRRQTRELGERNRELERFNSAMIGRELAMIELKTQINELSQQLGSPSPFPTTPLLHGTPPGTGTLP